MIPPVHMAKRHTVCPGCGDKIPLLVTVRPQGLLELSVEIDLRSADEHMARRHPDRYDRWVAVRREEWG